MAVYHQAQLALLVQRVGAEVDRYRAGELDAFDIDQVIFQYSRGEGALEVLQSGGRRDHRQLHPRFPPGRLVGPGSTTEAMKARVSLRRPGLKPALGVVDWRRCDALLRTARLAAVPDVAWASYT